MKIYLVKYAVLKTNTQGISVCEYKGIEGECLFTSKKKAYAFIEETKDKDWEYIMFPYEAWTNKEPFYTHENIKYYSRIELHEIEPF